MGPTHQACWSLSFWVSNGLYILKRFTLHVMFTYCIAHGPMTGLIIYVVEMLLSLRASPSILKYFRHLQNQLSVVTVCASVVYLLAEVRLYFGPAVVLSRSHHSFLISLAVHRGPIGEG